MLEYISKNKEIEINPSFMKELSIKIDPSKLNINFVQRGEDINALDRLRIQKDPTRVYNSKIQAGDDKMQVDLELQRISQTANLQQKYYNVKMPVLIEDAKVTIVRDKALLMRAGGYDEKKLFQDLGKYAKIGFD